jgi:antitoxin component YwqK of YwqJK toxin-antitoxin module
MKEYITTYGTLKGISHPVFHKNGSLSRCGLTEPVTLKTPVGHLVPLYDFYGRRSKSDSVSFYSNGTLKSICLHKQALIDTPAGSISAEKIIFYPSGKIKRLFPLDGSVTGFWTEQDESVLADPLKLNIGKNALNVRLIGACFYENDTVRSLTLWPGEKKEILTPLGKFAVRCGISYYENGDLKSWEPAFPYKIDTPIGKITAYDNNPLGINGDLNSVEFHSDGNLKSMKTDMNLIEVYKNGIRVKTISPKLVRSFMDPLKKELLPIKLGFTKEALYLEFENSSYSILDHEFIIKPYIPPMGLCSDCSSCSSSCS